MKRVINMKCINEVGMNKSLSITDLLAIERTILANERTLLAYSRTFLSFFVAGISLIQFFQYKIIVYVGYGFIPLGMFILIIGVKKYINAKELIYKIQHKK